MKYTTRMAIVLTVALTATATAQSRPDFSGVWRRINAPATAVTFPGQPAFPTLISTTIVQSATRMTVEYKSVQEGREQVLTYDYKLDGSESVNKIAGALHRTTAAWQDDALVLTSTVAMDGQSDWRVTDIYRLEKGNLVIENTTVNFRGTFSAKRVHEKH